MSYACPDEKCAYNGTLEKNKSCPNCGRTAQKFEQPALDNLLALKAEYQEFKRTRKDTKHFEAAGLKLDSKVAFFLGIVLSVSMLIVFVTSGSVLQFVAYVFLYLFLWVMLYYVSRTDVTKYD
jgi:uncharacterized Zn finger protein (UPF0148 family)